MAELALVTGGATGIGEACCRELAREGFEVLIHHNSSVQNAAALKSEIPGAELVRADIGTEAGVDEVLRAVRSLNKPLGVLVNNAGMNIEAPVALAKLEEFDKIVALNMRGTWLLTKKLIKLMIPRQAGRIINVTSVLGYTGNPYQSVYAMTKAAINNFTRTLAAELAPYQILVNAVAPGFIETPMTQKLPLEVKEQILSRIPLQRMGKPEEVAEVVAFLACRGHYMTGTTVHVNGGMYGG